MKVKVKEAWKKAIRTGLAAILFAVAIGGASVGGGPSIVHAAGNMYYVDAAGGNDANLGTSPALAWKTLSKVNATTFSAGDQILFKRGGVWYGQLYPKGSGALAGGVATPVTISSYGTGAKPLIDGGSLAQGAAVYLLNQEYWTIDGLEVTNNSGSDNATGVPRYGILVKGDNAGKRLNGITITNNDVHGVNGCYNCNGTIDPHINAGITVFSAQDTDAFANVYIGGNAVTDVGRNGITVWDYSFTSEYVNVPDGFNTRVVSIDANKAGAGLTVENNIVTRPDGDSILVYGYKNALIQHNVSNGAGQRSMPGYSMDSSAGIWPTMGDGTVVQYNEAFGTKLNSTDGQGFDVDNGHTNAVVQYNYSHDNQGGFLLLMDGYSSRNTVRYNISANDGANGQKGLITFSLGLPDLTNIYNNTFYIGAASAANPVYCDLCPGTNPGSWTFKNNIVYNLGSGTWQRPPGNNGTFDYNLFYGNHPASEPSDAHKLTNDPKLTNPGASPAGLSSPVGYRLQTGSPALYSGTVIAGNGGKDYFGNAVSATDAPSRGFSEGPGITQASAYVDPASDWSYTFSRSAASNWRVDASNAIYFNGDTGRFTRNTTATAELVYSLPNARQFSALIYEFSIDLSKVKFYSSPNGTVWTVVPSVYAPPTLVANGWSYTTYTPSANLPSGTNYLKVEFSDTTSAYGTQLSQISLTT
ncbi:right-handed parallel beta-helix repeat-containing protein [Cohnella sp. GCM10012308]|uniref:right-handed parallel beta-helix repeat-containing protein n=1 Tax=Cohnella sp. GCM10012308 TaxID=3317329 RepID=UPI00360F37BA